jgi:hypothetical protein
MGIKNERDKQISQEEGMKRMVMIHVTDVLKQGCAANLLTRGLH